MTRDGKRTGGEDIRGHLDRRGRARMVDVGSKRVSRRYACAAGRVAIDPGALARILGPEGQERGKGDVLAAARLAGIMAAKRTSELIPLCHSLELSWIGIDFTVDDEGIDIRCECRTQARTGVEMEALCGVSAAALTIYDMAKAFDRAIRITDLRLIEKRGGRSGTYRADRRR